MSIMVGVGRGAQAGRADQERRGAGAAREGRHPGRRQDRHADRRQAERRRRSRPRAGVDEDELLRLAASLERGSEHPLAAAIVARREERGLALAEVEDFDSLDRQGRHAARVDGRKRGARQRRAHGARPGVDAGRARRRRRRRCARDGATAIFVAVDGKAGRASSPIADPIKATTPAALAALHGGRHPRRHADRRQPRPRPRRWRGKLGIDEVEAEVLPRGQERGGRAAARARAASSPWPATASTTRRRWPRPMSASPWAPAPTSRSRAPASRC